MRIRFRWIWAAALIALGALAWPRARTRGAISQSATPDFSVDSRALSHPLRIIAYGDMRFTDPRETKATNPKVRRWLVDKVAEEKPDALLLSGDIPWHGGSADDYRVFHSETRRWWEEHLRVYPALGNHELYAPPVSGVLPGRPCRARCLENWWSAFPALGGHRWYSVKLGASVYILNLDSNSSLLDDSGQREWIREQLEHLPAGIRFVFVNMHHPPVVDFQVSGDASHNGRPNERALAGYLAQAPEKARVRFIVIAGHIHNYERFERDGITYLVSGGGGAEPRPIVRGPSDLYRDNGFPNYHYVEFTIDGSALKATMIRLADPGGDVPKWEEKDHFEVRAVESAGAPAGGTGQSR